MAVTPNLNLYKPDGADYVSVDRDLNENYDKIDEAVGKDKSDINNLQTNFGIVEDTDVATHDIVNKQYVIWKGALYRANQAIAIGTTLSATNLDAISNGMDVFNKLFTVEQGTVYGNGGNRRAYYYRMGNLCYVRTYGYFSSNQQTFQSYYCGTLPPKCRPKENVYGLFAVYNDTNVVGRVDIGTDGAVYMKGLGLWWYQQEMDGHCCFPCLGEFEAW